MSGRIGVNNGNFRGGIYKAYVDSVKKQIADPKYIHPRDIKLARLKAAMGEGKYELWYEKNHYARVATWEQLIDDALAEYETNPDAEIVLLQVRAEEITLALDECVSVESRQDVFNELAEIGNRLHALGSPVDEYAEARAQIKYGPEVE